MRLLQKIISSHRATPSYGTAKFGVGISAMGVLRPDFVTRCVIPVIMAGIIAVRATLSVCRTTVISVADLRPSRFRPHLKPTYVWLFLLRHVD